MGRLGRACVCACACRERKRSTVGCEARVREIVFIKRDSQRATSRLGERCSLQRCANAITSPKSHMSSNTSGSSQYGDLGPSTACGGRNTATSVPGGVFSRPPELDGQRMLRAGRALNGNVGGRYNSSSVEGGIFAAKKRPDTVEFGYERFPRQGLL